MVTLPKTLDEARALHREAGRRPADTTHLIREASTALDEQRVEDAQTLVAGALIAQPDRVEAWRLAARLALEVGETDDAETALRQALDLENDEGAVLELATLFLSDGRYEEAEGLASTLALQAESASIRARAEALSQTISERRSR